MYGEMFFDFQPSTSKKSSHRRHRSPIEDLIKCFCGACEAIFKRKDVKKALKANQQEVLEDPDLRSILKKFLEFKNADSHIPSNAMKIVEGFELAYSVLYDGADFSESQMDLEDFCFTEDWENRLSAAVDDDLTDEFLRELMDECARRLAEEPEYQMFKDELKRKLKLNH